MATSGPATPIAGETLRKSFYDKAVKQIAARAYKFKQAVAIISSDAWKNYFWRETTTVLDGTATTNPVKGIPRGAPFPNATGEWTRILTTIEKYGLEDTIPYEDIISNDVDVKNRTIIKISEGVAKAVDDEIWDELTESRAPSAIQSFTVTKTEPWNTASAAIIDDLLQARQLIATENYPTNNLMCFVSPKDYRSIMNYLAEKGAQFPAVGEKIADNGRAGKVAGIQLVESNSVTASYALVVVPKRCATWKQMLPLSTDVVERKFKDTTITACEMGVTQLTDPKAVVLIKGTDYPWA